MNKILVSFFSASGVTKRVAEKIATCIDGTLFEIEPVDKYTDADLDWTNKQSRTSIEMNDLSIRPKIKNKISNLDIYDTILIGFPVWWDLAPTIINTFLEEDDFTNKNIYIFATSGGSSVINSFNNLKNTYNNLHFISAKRFSDNIDEYEIKEWLNK